MSDGKARRGHKLSIDGVDFMEVVAKRSKKMLSKDIRKSLFTKVQLQVQQLEIQPLAICLTFFHLFQLSASKQTTKQARKKKTVSAPCVHISYSL